MGNTLFTERRNERRHERRHHLLHGLARVTASSFRTVFNRMTPPRHRNFDREHHARLLSEEFYNISDSDIAEHLITVHISYTETPRECTIYMTGFNDNHDKVLEGIINQDLTRNIGSECFMTYTQPASGMTTTRRFPFPFESTQIVEFFQQFTNRPENPDSNN